MNAKILPKAVLIVGIKGVAMSGIGTMLASQGVKVYGSDSTDNQITDDWLKHSAITIISLDDPIPQDVELVLYAGSHGGYFGKQVTLARERGISFKTQAQWIGDFLKQFQTSIAVCGTHGKTGTASLTVHLLKMQERKVSWLIGAPYFKYENDKGEVIKLEGAHVAADSDIFVFEADEYANSPPQDMTSKLTFYNPTHIICTTIDFDHPDVFKDFQEVQKTFREFFSRTENVYECNSSSIAENTLGVLSCLAELGLNLEKMEADIAKFKGVSRRREEYGEKSGVLYIDDYAHHPKEIKTTIDTLRASFPGRRLVVLFQSHTYSRTKMFLEEFAESLHRADVALIDRIFPSAREAAMTDETQLSIADEARRKGYTNVYGFQDRNQLYAYTKKILLRGDVVVTMGAGDIYKLIPSFMK